MKIAYSVGVDVPGGGIGNVAYNALKTLKNNHFLNQAYLTGNKTDFLKADEVTVFPILKRIPNYWVKDNLFDLLVSRKVAQNDIFHGWNNFCLYSLRRAKKKGAKIIVERASSHIVTQNRLLMEQMKKFGISSQPVNPLTLKKSVQEYAESDFVLVPSKFAFDSFLENGFDRQKLKLLPFGVDLEKFKPERVDDGIFRAVFVGQVGIRKGLPYLLEAWQDLDLPQSELVIVGPIFPDFKELIKKFSLKKVLMVNYSNDLSKYYKMSDVFVFPSIEEGSALVILEAMASGLPIICTPNSGSIIEDGKEGYLVAPGTSVNLKERLQDLYNNRDLAVKLGKNARKKVENFTWGSYHRNLLKIYEEIHNER